MAAVDVVTAVAADDVRQRLPGPNDVDLVGTTSPRPEVVVEDVQRKATPDARNIRDKHRLSDFDMRTTVGTGTFGRVVLVRHRQSRHFYALKILPIADVLRLKQAQHVRNEKEILVSTRHPFIVDLLWTNHTKQYLFMLFEFIGGGELFTYLRNAGRFENHAAVFYASEIVLIFEYLHSKSIIYRDLKPENLLLDRHGHIRLCDFGFAKMVEDRTWTLCGTPEYLAPEIILSKGYNKTVDWWALGIFIYEMLVGYPPFFDERPFGIYEKILGGQVNFPKDVEPSARDLIKRLLAQDRTKRLGTPKNGAEDVKHHRWFDLVNWDDVYAKKVKPPIVPEVLSEGDTHNFENYPNFEWSSETIISPEDLAMFDDF